MSTVQAPRRRDAEENRAGILAAAVAELATDPHASVDTIAKAADLSRRALYGHFEDRDGIVNAVIAAGAERFNAIARAVDDDDPRGALLQLASSLWAEAEHVHAVAALALNESFAPMTAEALAPLRARLVDICTLGFAQKTLRRDVPPAITARLVEEAARGVITHVDRAEAGAANLATRAALSAAGLGWAEVDDLVRSMPRDRASAPADDPRVGGGHE